MHIVVFLFFFFFKSQKLIDCIVALKKLTHQVESMMSNVHFKEIKQKDGYYVI